MTRVVPNKNELLNRSSGLEMDEGDERAPAPKRMKPNPNGNAPSSSALVGELKTLLSKLPTSTEARNSELEHMAG